VSIDNKTVPETVDALFAFLIEDYRTAKQSPQKYGENMFRSMLGADTLGVILGNPVARKVLPPDGQWKSALKKVLEDAEVHQGRYPEGLLIQLKKCLP
jgi:hypothetical protein